MINAILLAWDSPMHILLILIVVLILFGGKKIPEFMRGLGHGIKEFKEGMNGPEPGKEPEKEKKSTDDKELLK